MSTKTASISIDWGTHSSKWTWRYPQARSTEVIREWPYRIVFSDVQLDQDNQRLFLSDERPTKGSIYASNLKASLIEDPDEPFWVGPRKRIKATLGELVSFSLWWLISEAYNNVTTVLGFEPEKLDIRFSLPNWVDSEAGAGGRASYEQAAKIACHLFAADRNSWQENKEPIREEWQARIQSALGELKISDDSVINSEAEGFRTLLDQRFPVNDDVEFRFVAESSAAGLSGLRDEEADVDNKYLRKILVVDIGAGSTDIGYVIRSMPVDRLTDTDEVLIQLPPANTCEIAGADLTTRIMKIYRSQGDSLPFEEAEIRKITGDDKSWLKDPSVEQWMASIAEHVKEYVVGIPDEHWLPQFPLSIYS